MNRLTILAGTALAALAVSVTGLASASAAPANVQTQQSTILKTFTRDLGSRILPIRTAMTLVENGMASSGFTFGTTTVRYGKAATRWHYQGYDGGMTLAYVPGTSKVKAVVSMGS
jgi:hypothetical protein